jgi:hypothetical protein
MKNKPDTKQYVASQKVLHALIATWILIERSPDILQRIGHRRSKITKKTLHEIARDAIDQAKAAGITPTENTP